MHVHVTLSRVKQEIDTKFIWLIGKAVVGITPTTDVRCHAIVIA